MLMWARLLSVPPRRANSEVRAARALDCTARRKRAHLPQKPVRQTNIWLDSKLAQPESPWHARPSYGSGSSLSSSARDA
jgi:hypothetical protein